MDDMNPAKVRALLTIATTVGAVILLTVAGGIALGAGIIAAVTLR